jgi:predicted alpha/beta superfamily hydrolase
MKRNLSTLFTLMLSIGMVFSQEKEESAALVLPQIQVVPIRDTQANRQYELYIELPEGYSESSDKSYPVLYYMDAVWHREILSAGAEYILTDAILVGVSWQKDPDKNLLEQHGEHVSRYWDYTIQESTNPEQQAKYQLGQANNHLNFIQQDVIPYVEGNYRTDPENRSYFGYSLSGLFGAYVLLSQPDTFRNYILGSASMRGNIKELERLASNISGSQGMNANVFISYGSAEDELRAYGRQFIDLLEARNDQQLSITYKVLDGNHQSAFPLTGVQSVFWLAGLLEH